MTDKEDISVQSGSCQCTQIRYEIVGLPLDIYICHCKECQKQSSSAFGISVLIKSEQLRLLYGAPKIWTRSAKNGGTIDCSFCPTCGARVWHGNPDTDDIISIKGGSLDHVPDLKDVSHIWTASKVPGLSIPEHQRCFIHNKPDEGRLV